MRVDLKEVIPQMPEAPAPARKYWRDATREDLPFFILLVRTIELKCSEPLPEFFEKSYKILQAIAKDTEASIQVGLFFENILRDFKRERHDSMDLLESAMREVSSIRGLHNNIDFSA